MVERDNIKNVTLYAYLDIEHPMVAWEVAIGRVKSISDNNSDKFDISLWQYFLLSKYVRDGINIKSMSR